MVDLSDELHDFADTAALIDNLDLVFPGLKMELYDEEEDLVMPGIAVVVDGETSQLGLLEHVREDSEIHFLPALGGGAL